jgi:hypothetical protein
MTNCKEVVTPANTKPKASADEGTPLSNGTFYRSMAGALQYLTVTCLDIAFAVQQVCLHMHSPRDVHLTITTGNPGFAESQKVSAKANKPSAKALSTVALGTGLTENFFSATALCRAPKLQDLGAGYVESPQWAVGQKK